MTLRLYELISRFVMVGLVCFIIFALLIWTPIKFIPLILSFGAVSWTGLMMVLIFAGAPFGGLVLLLITTLWRGDWSGFWKDAGGLLGFWFGAISGSAVGMHVNEGNF